MKPNEELLLKIGTVRNRWKAFLWARGLAWTLGVLVISLVIGLYMANSTAMPTWAVNSLRVGMVVLLAFTLIKALIFRCGVSRTTRSLHDSFRRRIPVWKIVW